MATEYNEEFGINIKFKHTNKRFNLEPLSTLNQRIKEYFKISSKFWIVNQDRKIVTLDQTHSRSLSDPDPYYYKIAFINEYYDLSIKPTVSYYIYIYIFYIYIYIHQL